MTGEALSEAYASMDEFGRFKICCVSPRKGRNAFGEVTKAIADEGHRAGRLGQLAIVLDGKLYSAPAVREEIPSGSAEITGQFSQREALELANVLNNPLDLPLDIKEQYEVGPSLATDAISSGVRASVIGAVLVAAFMITYYTVGGVIAVGVLAVNITIILGVLASIGATMTLPGLAGIVLTIGMAVDANILIFERMREELHLGKNLKTALVAGYDKAFFTIVDAHVTQLCICAIMIWLGTGSKEGGGLALSLLLKLIDRKEVLPRGAIRICPWVDLAMTGKSLKSNEGKDLIHAENIKSAASLYLAGHNPKDPLASPLYGNLEGLPPLLIQVGTREVFLDEIEHFAKKAKESGVPVELQKFEGMIHTWHLFSSMVVEGQLALERIGEFVKNAL